MVWNSRVKEYFRPIVQNDKDKPSEALRICGTSLWFSHVEVITRSGCFGLKSVDKFPFGFFKDITSKRKPVGNINFNNPIIMGIVNLTPDSFSDGGKIKDLITFNKRMIELVSHGAGIIDIGGESTKPGSKGVSYSEEKDRLLRYLESLSSKFYGALISLDTRKSKIVKLSTKFNVKIINDVSAGSFDKDMLDQVAKNGLHICLCHSVNEPEFMHLNPCFENVVLDVYDQLEEKIEKAVRAGIKKDRILIDPGIGFGKTGQHNMEILQKISIFHGLGCPIVLGVSRKKFIRTQMLSENDLDVTLGSILYSLEAIRQGIQIVRVHDVREMRKCLNVYHSLWS